MWLMGSCLGPTACRAVRGRASEQADLADQVHWAVDISGTSSALLPALLAAHGRQAVYVPGQPAADLVLLTAHRTDLVIETPSTRGAFRQVEGVARNRSSWSRVGRPSMSPSLVVARAPTVAARRRASWGPQA